MASKSEIVFVDRSDISGPPGYYITIEIISALALKSWKFSLFSFEWLRPDGSIKSLEELDAEEAEKRRVAEKKFKTGAVFEKPILGIGLMDNVEIGAGRADFLTLIACGVEIIPVHIRASNESDFKAFRAGL
ncbi:MAG: hypothetical protein IT559_03305 [Alphaproteobacteria bacterium]|nr:hypothetical protein [Alphaproteobacteria bacterium]